MSLTDHVTERAVVAKKSDGNQGGELRALLARQKAAQDAAGAPSYEARLDHLRLLERVVLTKKNEIARAIGHDFGNRSKHETFVGEVMIVVQAIKYVRARLRDWMLPEAREVSWMFQPGRAELVMQPVGVVGIIAPWNYPVQLALGPLVSVLAAGNRAIMKPSELVPETADLLAALVRETFAEDHVAVVNGGPEVSEALSRLPLDHLVFTGSTRVGKLVMKAAAENLVPVTLELGGKSPAIVGEGFAIGDAAERIMMGKTFNAGQTCIAPDYVLVPKVKRDAFVDACRTTVAAMYPSFAENADYTTIVNDRQYQRLQASLRDARERGAKVIELNATNEPLSASSRKLAPHLVLDASEDTTLMQEEIFGPILPIRTYDTLDEAIAYVNAHPRPLALYLFEHDRARVDRVLARTISGGVSINETMLHCAVDDLPFGGIGASGIGHYHAREGFDAFTKKKPIFHQSRVNGAGFFKPPYGKPIDFVLKMLLGK